MPYLGRPDLDHLTLFRRALILSCQFPGYPLNRSPQVRVLVPGCVMYVDCVEDFHHALEQETRSDHPRQTRPPHRKET